MPETIYTHGTHESVVGSHNRRGVADSAAYLVPHLRPGLAVLDAGCGPGSITADLAALVAPGRVVALDASAELVARAEATARDRGLANVEIATGDVHRLAYADGTFDVVHAHQVLQHVADPVAALRELRRVTAPDGVVAARDADYGAFAWYPELPALDDWRALYREVARRNGGEPDAGRRLLAWARAAGFGRVTTSVSVWSYATPETRTTWGHMWAERVRASAIAEQAVAYGLATRDDLERIAAAWRDWAADEDGWIMIPHGEILASG